MSFVMIRIRDLVMRLPSGGRSLTILDGITLDVDAAGWGGAPWSGDRRRRRGRQEAPRRHGPG